MNESMNAHNLELEALGCHLVTTRAHTNPGNWGLEELLDPVEVSLGLRRELLEGPSIRNALLPAGEGLVDRLDVVESVNRAGHETVRKNLAGALALVRNTDLDLLELVKAVELGNVDGCVAVNHARVLHQSSIKPSAAALAAGGDSNLASDLLQVSSDLSARCSTREVSASEVIGELGREGSRSHTGGVGLDNANAALHLVRGEAHSSANSSNSGGGRCHERVSTVVDVKHASVGTLGKNVLAFLVSLVQEMDSVTDHVLLKHLVTHVLDLSEFCFFVDGHVEHALVGLSKSSVRSHKVLPWLLEHACADTVAGHLGGVSRTNALLGGAKLATTTSLLEHAIDLLVEIKEEVGTVRDLEAALSVDASLLKRKELIEDCGNVHDASVAENVDRVLVYETTREKVEGKLLAVDHERVASVGTTTKTHAVVKLLLENIGKLALALICGCV